MSELAHVERLVALADAFHQEHDTSADAIQTTKAWSDEARTFTYHTHTALAGVPREALAEVADAFYGAADLETQPWYAQFRAGQSCPVAEPAEPGVARQQWSLSAFDVGLRKLRCYRQLVTDGAPRPDMRVVALRSVDAPLTPPADAVLALTLAPTGDVFEWRDERLHWHHICTTPGVGLLPGSLDRSFLNTLRRLGLDAQERRTYREEAEAWREWVGRL